MTKNEFLQKIENAFEMVITIGEKRFTITDENEKGISIAEWGNQQSERYFPDARTLIDGYIIDDRPIGEQAEFIMVKDYTGM